MLIYRCISNLQQKCFRQVVNVVNIPYLARGAGRPC